MFFSLGGNPAILPLQCSIEFTQQDTMVYKQYLHNFLDSKKDLYPNATQILFHAIIKMHNIFACPKPDEIELLSFFVKGAPNPNGIYEFTHPYGHSIEKEALCTLYNSLIYIDTGNSLEKLLQNIVDCLALKDVLFTSEKITNVTADATYPDKCCILPM